ncbi:type II secretion system minor pseudopilin GspJ [Novosphingobium sp. FKTRR1]|uniref:type II secretion system minor pseudopilin GspJ n=1 Tax=Novosphingobium sp. FKTRR1 TaxID=2879118 RepID=UPI001CF036CB|nr:type II secretion system minor pseudopilin GspJ [Novosphingobium sp. FKTRR1]
MISRPVNGFTLVEMLVALSIFAMLASSGLLLLRFSVDAEQVSRQRTAAIAERRRFLAIWTADLAQAAARPSRDQSGIVHPALESTGAVLLRLTRGGWDNPDAAPRASLQKVEYRWDGRSLVRTGYPYLDGAAQDQGAALLALRAAPTIRWRMGDGRWRATWQPTGPTDLPVAVEILLPFKAGQVPLRVVTPVGPGVP